MDWPIPAAILVAVVAWAIRFAVYSQLGFWIEVWRQPYLALVLFARDPAWRVCEEDPATLTPREGWIGPLTLCCDGLKIGMYLDRDQRAESTARIKAALVCERRKNR